MEPSHTTLSTTATRRREDAAATTAHAPAQAAELPDRLRQVVVRLARRLRQESGDEASPTQLAVLAVVGREGPLTLGELAAAERVRPPTITAAVRRLEARGLVARRADPRDRRVTHVEITAEGRRLLTRIRARRSAYLARRLRELDDAERASLERAVPVLERLL